MEVYLAIMMNIIAKRDRWFTEDMKVDVGAFSLESLDLEDK